MFRILPWLPGRWKGVSGCLLFALAAPLAGGDEIDFLRDIQPLLQERCERCHGTDKQRGGLRLDLKASALKGGDSGVSAIVAGDVPASRLYQLVTSTDEDERMPPSSATEARLNAAELDRIRRWIESGAVWPDSHVSQESAGPPEMKVTEADRQHWSFVPLKNPGVPTVNDSAWLQTPIDAFIRHVQERQSLSPSPQAEARTLVRRLFFGMIGLPPTPEEMRYWIQEINRSRDAVRVLIDTLLDSPHYGERWARHWLDVARYADSNGMELDADRPNAYRYRDFVIRAFNNDLPFDTFVRWQLAGDELAPAEPDALAATGFIAAGVNTILPDQQMVEEKLRNRANELDDMVSTTGQALLGLTLACARCHDHKYDPLPTRDYYRLTRIFNGGDRAEVPLVAPDVVVAYNQSHSAWKREYDAMVKEQDDWVRKVREPVEARLREERITALAIGDEQKQLLRERAKSAEAKKLADRFKKALEITDDEVVARLTERDQERWREFGQSVAALAAREPEALPKAFAFADFGSEPTETWFFERGDFLARNEKMDLGFLSVLTSGKTPEDYWEAARRDARRNDSTQQRRALAEWMIDLKHGSGALLARVMVNRIWQHHFGVGLVSTASDFGSRGERPTHPQLMEWLASEFVRSGWSLKHLHRLILNSATYQQSSDYNETMAQIEPENRLLWRQRPVRLEAEVLRDSMLSVAGTLNRQQFGPAFKPPIQIEALQARNVRNPYPKNAPDVAGTRRRSVYMFHKRVVQYPLMQAFDAPDGQQSCGRRMNTTVAPQALVLLNDPFVRARAVELADRVQRDTGAAIEEQVRTVFQLGLGRGPDSDELSRSSAFIRQQAREREARGEAEASRLALVDFCQSMFGLNEFIYVD